MAAQRHEINEFKVTKNAAERCFVFVDCYVVKLLSYVA